MERIPNEFSNLSLKIDDLKSVIDKFVSIRNLDISEIEIASAKTITEITDKVKLIQTALNSGYDPLEDYFDEEQIIYK